MTKKNHIKSDNENGIAYLKIALKAAISQVMNDKEKVLVKGLCFQIIQEALDEMGIEVTSAKPSQEDGVLFVLIQTHPLYVFLDLFRGYAVVHTRKSNQDNEKN